MPDSIGLDDAVDDGLVVDNLAGGYGGCAAGLHRCHEGAELLVEQVAAGIQGNLCAGGLACDGLVDLQGLVEVPVPALGGRNLQAALCAQDDGVAHGVHVHGPGSQA